MPTLSGEREGDLARAVLLYAVRCLEDGNVDRLRAIGLGGDEAALLGSLSLKELSRAGILCAHGVWLRVDPEILRVVVGHLQSTRRTEELQRRLILADAPREMMHRMFGMSSREFAELRRQLGVATGVGRPAELDETAEHRLWHAMAGRLGSDPDSPLEPEQVLELHAETGVPLRAIWSRARSWAGLSGGRR